ncbi:MAG: DUF177 domain-containing protein [Chloroflexi bacterium]|nr:DUF177 domain-containing protein [Chloroflexota bacterium]
MAGFNPFRLNVGFIAAEEVGYQREFDLAVASVRLDDLEARAVTGMAAVSRTPQGLLVHVHVEADTPQICARCLKPFQQHLVADFEELYAFNEKSVTESGLRYPYTGILDLAPLIREYLILDIPISPICHPDCKGLCPVCGADRNVVDCGHDTPATDPRWDALRALLSDSSSSGG